ncbi:MAG TPA: hypothetical protein ENI62_04370 [Gammaproteobacteria bacterium]|nr:hypothetical protein [Gammaproteobacteria bacterium]
MGSFIGKAVFWFFFAGFFLSSGCTVNEPPQNNVSYQPAPYPGQISQETLKRLKNQYPEGFFKQMKKVVPEAKKLRIGIAMFVGSGSVANLATPTTEIFSTTFVQTGLFKIYSRDKLDKIVAEVELGMTGLVDPATAQQAGKLAGLQFLLTGKLSVLQGKQRMDIKVINVATGEIVLVEKTEGIIDTGNSKFLAHRLARRLAEKYYAKH